jgi:hypothetical protein
VEYLIYVGSMTTSDARCTRAMGISSIEQEVDCFHQETGLEFQEGTGEVLEVERSIVWC